LPTGLKIVLKNERTRIVYEVSDDEMGWGEQNASASQNNDINKFLEILEGMGFTRKRSLRVLRKLDGDLEKAANVLVDWHQQKENRIKKRKFDEELLPQATLNIENLQIDGSGEDVRQRNKKFREIGNTANVQLPKDGPWPAQFTRIFVDGNNLMFLTNGLRKLTLQKKFREIENVLASITEHFSENTKITAILIFDGTPSNSQKTLPNGSSLTVTSARPEFPTTDQALIHWAKNNPSEVASSVVVTSDRALSGELSVAGLASVKPAEWLKFVASGDDYKMWIEEKVSQSFQ
jgi:predicted RNA-binding protein with PIN domain